MSDLRLSADCRDLRRRLDALAWMVLEDLALDADGHGIAPTSARRIADNLGIDAGLAATALRQLRTLHLIEPAHSSGRFELSAYALLPARGITLVPRS